VPLAELGPGDFFGEIALLDGGPRPETARALSDVALLALGRHDFMDLLDRCPTAGAHVVAVQAGRLRELLEHRGNGHFA
jgi:CRP-like cAMP-binding protein